ncbi:MAG: MFS transporter [Lachnospiraceae bacterium]|nr:MFS transporter [Lachnospiraceae bacterium]
MDADTELKQHKIHHAWLVMIACCALYATVGLLNNTQGLYYPAICADLGCKTSQFTITTVFNGLAAMVTLGIVDKVYKRFPTRIVLFLMVTLFSLSFVLRSFARSFVQFCVVYIIMGIASAFIIYVPIPMLINKWFVRRRGLALGVSLLMSGVAASVSSPIINHFIDTIGWQKTGVINAVAAFLISGPVILLFVRTSPEDVGLLPYGMKERDVRVWRNENQNDPETPEKIREKNKAKTERSKEETIKFVICFVMAVALMLIAGIYHQFSNFSVSIGVGTAVGATLLSLNMIGNMVSKAVIGPCVDRFGGKKTMLCAFLLVILSFIMMTLYIVPGFLYIGAFLTGIAAATNGIALPIMIGSFAEGDDYVYYTSKVAMGTMLSTAFITYIGSAIYDLCGTYAVEFIIYAVMQFICIILMFILLKDKEEKK